MAINFIRVSPTGFALSTQVPLEYNNELVMDLCDAITSYEHDNDNDLYFWNILNAIYVQLDRQSMLFSHRVIIEQYSPLIDVPHALMEHLQLLAWLPYLTTLANDIHYPRPEGLDTTLSELHIYKETIQEAERVSGLHLF